MLSRRGQVACRLTALFAWKRTFKLAPGPNRSVAILAEASSKLTFVGRASSAACAVPKAFQTKNPQGFPT